MSTAPEILSEGRYRIERVLGVGGMSVVLLAFDNRMHVQRAIKLLHKRFAKSPQVRERFENEAYAQARLRHPNILMVHDVVEDQAGVYLVMEVAEGGSLADRVKQKGPLSPREAAQAGITICRALGVAHAEGVIHRDIKPENVLVDRHGTLKVADFGIARVVDRHANLTQTGMVMGTWAYMPPEQRESARQVDGRADIYALGATLFYLLTGRQPTALHNPETHRREYEDFPEPLARAIQKATRLYPEDRYQTCEELAADLDSMLSELGTERFTDFQPPEAPPDTLAPAIEDLSTFLHGNQDAAETLAPFLEQVNLANLAPDDGTGTAVPGTQFPAGRTPSLFLPPPAAPPAPTPLATPAPQADIAAQAVASTPPVSTPVTLPPLAPSSPTPTVPPGVQTAPGRSGISGSQLLIFVLGVLVAVIAIAVLLPRLVNPGAGADPALEGTPTGTTPPQAASVGAALPDAVPSDAAASTAAPSDAAASTAAPSDAAPSDAVPSPGERGSAGSTSGTGSATSAAAQGSTSTGSSGTQPRIITLANPLATTASTATTETGGSAAAPQDPSGVVVVKTVPSGASVRAGGQTLEKSGRGYVLPIGSHVLEVVSPTGEQTRIPVEVRRDQTIEICYSFDTNSACATAN